LVGSNLGEKFIPGELQPRKKRFPR
jgi:hypothetical protein